MYFTGFADEAASDIDGQIKATQAIGWSNIEARNVDGTNIHDLPDDKFDEVCQKLDAAGVKINCFGSTICNWQKQITDPPEPSIEEAKRAIPRMKRLGAKLIRVMSYAKLAGEDGKVDPGNQMKEERFKRVREIVQMFADEGLTPVHENCMNYGGMGAEFTLELIENVPGLKLVFDTGNPVFSPDFTKPGPDYPMQSAWEFYDKVKEHVAYIHIKDGYIDHDQGKTVFTFPAEGEGDVRRIVKDMLDNGYDGGISIEPHMAVVFHDDSAQSEDQIRFDNYVEYGRRMMDIVRAAGHKDKLT